MTDSKDSLIALIEREKYIYGEHPEAAAFNSAMDKAITIIRNHPMPNVAWCIEHYPNDCKCNMGGVSESANSQSGDSAPAPPATMEEAACYESEIIEKRLQREISVISEDVLHSAIWQGFHAKGFPAKHTCGELADIVMPIIRPYLRTAESSPDIQLEISNNPEIYESWVCRCHPLRCGHSIRVTAATMPVSVSLERERFALRKIEGYLLQFMLQKQEQKQPVLDVDFILKIIRGEV